MRVVTVLPGSGERVRSACAADDDHRGGGVEGEVKGQRLSSNWTSRRQAPGGEQLLNSKMNVTLVDVTRHPEILHQSDNSFIYAMVDTQTRKLR